MILILDFGSQYTQLIARRVREANVYCEIHPFNFAVEKIRALKPYGIILSGGPSSTYDDNAPDISDEVLGVGCPVLGICYGLYIIAQHLGARSVSSRAREYGPATLVIDEPDLLFEGLAGKEHRVWMSHGDRVEALPESLQPIAHSGHSPFAAFRTSDGRMRAIQFHPEVVHTPCGAQVLRNFVLKVCGEAGDWTMANFVRTKTAEIRAQVGATDRVLMALSGGVDSAVAAALLYRAIGTRLKCVFVDTGLARAGERERMERIFARQRGVDLKVIDASDLFLARLAGVLDPENKRKIIGATFIEVFESEEVVGGGRFLGQGTLYPDVIESVSFKGPSAVIKSHHNVGGLPERMKLELIEPLRLLFKDEVRALGRELGLPSEIVDREPFPGPGLAVRIVGEVTRERLDLLRRADAIVMEEISRDGFGAKLWQAFAVLLPLLKTVGVMGDGRSYESTIAIRAVESQDGMTADWARLPPDFLARLSSRITNETKGVNRVVYDITSKPPATIEWE
jgi:GMP synthase (glutamine-hydrolysing)